MNCPKEKLQQGKQGQALIVILLVSAVGLTLGLSLASRSTNDTNITTEIEESSRAFSAAEAGLEESAQHIGNIGFSSSKPIGSGDYNVSIETACDNCENFEYPGKIENNKPVIVWLVGHKKDGENTVIDTDNVYGGDSINICWGKDGGDYAALEATLYYKLKSPVPLPAPLSGTTEYALARAVYNPNSTDYSGKIIKGTTGRADKAAKGDCGGDFRNKKNLSFSGMASSQPYSSGDSLRFMKIRPIIVNNDADTTSLDTRIAIEKVGGDNLKSQGEIHISTGTSSNGQKTKIVQFISHPVAPEIFDTVIYSSGGIIKATPTP
jgi:Tfp pilus assembly protein PilX